MNLVALLLTTPTAQCLLRCQKKEAVIMRRLLATDVIISLGALHPWTFNKVAILLIATIARRKKRFFGYASE